MASITGFECDVCKAFATSRTGWLKVNPVAEATGDRGFDVCSNRCLIRLGTERAALAGEVLVDDKRRRRGRFTDEERLEILTFADEHGTQAAATKYGVAYSTVWQWGKEAGS